jgi:predicted nucleotidyltransferase
MGRVQKREDILSYIGSRKAILKNQYHVRKIALIGSFARNEQTSESDIDLLIDLEENTPKIYEVKRSLRKELEEQFGRKVEIASERYLRPYYKKEILQDAIYV